MRYFFHLFDGSITLLDEEGRDLRDLTAAQECAVAEVRGLMAEEIRSGHLDLNQRIEVYDHDGELVHVQKFADAVQIAGG